MKIFLVITFLISFGAFAEEMEKSEPAEKGQSAEKSEPTQDETQAKDLYKKYPEIEKVINNAPAVEGAPDVKCPAECQSSQMTCTRNAGPEKRDECRNSYSSCMSNCGGFTEGMDMESLNSPSELLKDVELPENLKSAAVKEGQGQGDFSGFNASSGASSEKQGVSAPKSAAPKSINMDDAFGGGASK